MAVYFIRAGRTGPVKIGWAGDPWGRLAQLQKASPEKLSMLAIIDGGREEERHLHVSFADAHLRGEWFWLSDELRGFLKRQPPAGPRPKNPRKLRHTRIPREETRTLWFDPNILTDMAVTRQTGHGPQTLQRWFGPSGRNARGMTGERARMLGALGAAARKKQIAANRLDEAAARAIWKDTRRYPSVEEALEHMPGWTRTTAWRRLGKGREVQPTPMKRKR